jgi:hypothetical protein
VWRITQSRSSVQSVTYNTVACSGNAYGITAVNQNGQSTSVIWDRLQVQGYSVSDSRANVNDNVNVDVTVWFDYDDTPCTTATITVNGYSATHLGNGVYRITRTSSTVASETYNTVACSAESAYGITAVDQNGKSAAVIWDRIKVSSLTADDARRDVGSTATLSVQLIYEYDSAYIASGTFALNGLALTYSGSNGVWRATDSKSAVQAVTYNSVSGTEGAYGLTAVNMNGQSATVIWDRFKVIGISADDGRRDVGTTATLDVTIKYEYDDVAVTTGSFTLNGLALTHQGSGVWRATDSRSTVQAVTYNSVSGSGDTYGLSVVNMNGQSATVIWDRIEVYGAWVSDSRADVGSTQYVYFQLRYDYDDAVFDSSKGTVTIGGVSASWDSGNQRWYVSTSKSSVGLYSYALGFTDSAYGLTAFETGEAAVVWDKARVYYEDLNISRVNVNDPIAFRVKALLLYDNHPFDSSDSITASFGSLTWDAANGWFRGARSRNTVGNYTFSVSSLYEATYGITAFEANVSDPVGVWDGIEIGDCLVDLEGDRVYIYARYAYDGLPIPNCTVGYAGLTASTNATGWAALGLSGLREVAWNTAAYGVSEPQYNLTYSYGNRTVAYHKVYVEPFTVRASCEILNASWSYDARRLSFSATGACVVGVGGWGRPSRVEVNGAPYSDWSYDPQRQEVTVRNLASQVALIWEAGAPPSGPQVYLGPASSLAVSAKPVELGTVARGATLNFTLELEFGAMHIIVNEVRFDLYGDRIRAYGLPAVYARGLDPVGRAEIPCSFEVPESLAPGSTVIIPYVVYATGPDGSQAMSGASLTLTVQPEAPGPPIPGGISLLLIFAALTSTLAYYSLRRK